MLDSPPTLVELQAQNHSDRKAMTYGISLMRSNGIITEEQEVAFIQNVTAFMRTKLSALVQQNESNKITDRSASPARNNQQTGFDALDSELGILPGA